MAASITYGLVSEKALTTSGTIEGKQPESYYGLLKAIFPKASIAPTLLFHLASSIPYVSTGKTLLIPYAESEETRISETLPASYDKSLSEKDSIVNGSTSLKYGSNCLSKTAPKPSISNKTPDLC